MSRFWAAGVCMLVAVLFLFQIRNDLNLFTDEARFNIKPRFTIVIAENLVIASLALETLGVDEIPVPVRITAELASAVGELLFQVSSASYEISYVKQVTRDQVVGLLSSLDIGRPARVTILEAAFIFLVPFLKNLYKDSNVIVAGDSNGFHTIFGNDTVLERYQHHPFLVNESVIDAFCIQRKKSIQTYERPSCKFSNRFTGNKYKIKFPRGHYAIPCDTMDILAMRKAMIWRNSFQKHSNVIMKTPLVHDTPILTPIMHVQLVSEILSILGNPNHFSFPLAAVPFCPQKLVLEDAGTCWTGDRDPSQKANYAVAHCLPSVIIAGVQKAATGELAQWMSVHPRFRRQDGGLETHYFDCMYNHDDRKSCFSLRDPRMALQGALSSHNLKVHASNSISFSWANLTQEEGWSVYKRLGHLNFDQFEHERRMVFDKTPAYFDLAKPVDVLKRMPSVKLIFIFREPVQRLYSSYYQQCRNTEAASQYLGCSDSEFSSLVNLALNEQKGRLYRGLLLGKYSLHLEKWVSVFPLDQFFISFFQVFNLGPKTVLREIGAFLSSRGPTTYQPAEYGKGVFNIKPFEFKPEYLNNHWVIDSRKSKAVFEQNRPQTIPIEVAKKLENYYRPWNIRLRKFLDENDLYTNSKIIGYPSWLNV